MWQLKIFQLRRELNFRRISFIFILSLLVIGLGFYLFSYLFPPKVFVASVQTSQAISEPLVIKFSYPPARRSLLVKLEPEVDGSWEWRGALFGRLADELVFQPDTTWPPLVQYQLTVENVEGALGNSRNRSATSASFQTKGLPNVTTLSSLECEENLSACQKTALEKDLPIPTASLLQFDLDQANDKSAQFSFTFTPSIEFGIKTLDDDRGYILSPKAQFAYGQRYELTVEREALAISKTDESVIKRGQREKVWQSSFITVSAPAISSFTPQGVGQLPNLENIIVVFSEPMAESGLADKIIISPLVEGSWQWENEMTLSFKLTAPLKLATQYLVTIPSNIKTKSGSTFDQESVFKFTTIGEIRVTKFSPGNGASINSNISLTFDQPVNQASAEQAFSIVPSVNGSFSWNDRVLKFSPSVALDYFKSYKVTLKSGVVSLYGYNLAKDLSFDFITEEKIVILNVKYDRQDRALSCEAAALKMALVFKGANVSEDDIMAIIGFDPTVRSGGVWGDPSESFVGNIDGSQNSTGYGVYWDPIARAAKQYRQAESFTGGSLTALANAIDQGNPVVVWGTTGNAYQDSWLTPSGKTIDAWKGEHTRTVIGYKGSPDHVSSIVLIDPLVGKITWSAAKFNSNWAQFNNAGVIIY